MMRGVMSLEKMEDSLGRIVSTLFGIACFVGTIYHEVEWRFMLGNWQRANGKITAEVEGGETSSPEIEYEYRGKPVRFVSKYGGGPVRLGESVIVLFDPDTGEAEKLKWSNRWLPTIAMLSFGITFLAAGMFVGSYRQATFA